MKPTSQLLFLHCLQQQCSRSCCSSCSAVSFLYTPFPFSVLSFLQPTNYQSDADFLSPSTLFPPLTSPHFTPLFFLHNTTIMVGSSFSSCLPHWLAVLLKEKFFNPCLAHESIKKNEKNIFCLDCCISICPHCLDPHRSHRLLQIRRYVYHDVVRLDDLEKLIDCDYVQSYITNSARVVFINERPQTRPFRGSGNICSTCDRSLQDPYLFCSLSCKVSHLVKSEGGISRHLYECEFLPFTERESSYDIDDGQMTPDSILEPPISMLTSSGSSGGGGGGGGGGEGVCCRILACTAATDYVRKKRSSLSASRPTYRPILGPAPDIVNRRKAVAPQRSPLY